LSRRDHMCDFNSGKYSDITLTLGTRKWKLHRMFLAQHSTLLRRMLRKTDMADGVKQIKGRRTLELSEELFTDADMLDVALRGMYTSTLAVSGMNDLMEEQGVTKEEVQYGLLGSDLTDVQWHSLLMTLEMLLIPADDYNMYAQWFGAQMLPDSSPVWAGDQKLEQTIPPMFTLCMTQWTEDTALFQAVRDRCVVVLSARADLCLPPDLVQEMVKAICRVYETLSHMTQGMALQMFEDIHGQSNLEDLDDPGAVTDIYDEFLKTTCTIPQMLLAECAFIKNYTSGDEAFCLNRAVRLGASKPPYA